MAVPWEQSETTQSNNIDMEYPKDSAGHENKTIDLTQPHVEALETDKAKSLEEGRIGEARTDEGQPDEGDAGKGQAPAMESHKNSKEFIEKPLPMRDSIIGIFAEEPEGEALFVIRDQLSSSLPADEFLATLWSKLASWDFSDHQALNLLPILNLVCLVWSIIVVELMIRWNRITEV